MGNRITLHMAAIRLATVRRGLYGETLGDAAGAGSAQLRARVDGKLINLTKENFKIDDDGTLIINTET